MAHQLKEEGGFRVPRNWRRNPDDHPAWTYGRAE